MEVFLDSPQDFGNLCLLSRTLEERGVERCYVHDPHRLIRRRYGKSRTRQIKTISAGAFFRVAFERVEQPESFLPAKTDSSNSPTAYGTVTTLANLDKTHWGM
jgi:hypothetical protein